MTNVTVKVREQEIIEGRQGCEKECAVALAIDNVLKRGYYASVTGRSIRIFSQDMNPAYLDSSSDVCIYWNPIPEPTIYDFIIAYDDGKEVSPFEFDIELPDRVVREVK